ncbi:unnamed protein product [Rotaria sordida]|uniref:Uncharacterized protein n=1 Tax=Rotaria sordida TaxID=392033 RepID=A0A820BFX3_9BILA|nr:unnamed protein product [Rotaria sordida]
MSILLDNSQIIDDEHEDEKLSDHNNDSSLSKINMIFTKAIAYCDELELNDLIEQRISTMMKILLREKPDIILLQQIETFPLTLYD